LFHVVFDEFDRHLWVLEVFFGFGFSEGRHVEEFAVRAGVLEVVERDGLNVVHQIRQLLRNFLKKTVD
jgi:hypothetical protein